MQPRLKLDIGWRDLASVWRPGTCDASKLEQAIAAHAPAGTIAVVALSVRSLFVALLAELPAASPIVMSAVTIEDMATLVTASGRKVRPVDIQMDTLLPDAEAARIACSEDAAMLVVAHLYGSRASIEAVASACTLPGRLIVEDCAQAFDGALRLSPGADVALYSFGPIKTATALGGAVGLFRDRALADRVRARMADWPRHDEIWFLRRAMKFALLKLVSAPLIYRIALAVISWRFGETERVIGSLARGFSGRPIDEAVRYRPPPRLLRLLELRLRTWKSGADTVTPALQRLSRRLTVPGLAARPSHWWLAPVLATSPDALVAGLRRMGYDATRGTTSMRALTDSDGKASPVASRLMAGVVYLPKPANLAAAGRLADAVDQVAHSVSVQDERSELI